MRLFVKFVQNLFQHVPEIGIDFLHPTRKTFHKLRLQVRGTRRRV
jgi:hypothetical protein